MCHFFIKPDCFRFLSSAEFIIFLFRKREASGYHTFLRKSNGNISLIFQK